MICPYCRKDTMGEAICPHCKAALPVEVKAEAQKAEGEAKNTKKKG